MKKVLYLFLISVSCFHGMGYAADGEHKGGKIIVVDESSEPEGVVHKISLPERPLKPSRPEQPLLPERVERVERPERPDRPSRPEAIERVERPQRPDLPEKPQ